ncbi:MAG: radical SAM protein, partial [Epsilonproteobacteria bacterium]|nr:radical SAM protein [Campylobacterota bacterium]
NSLKGDKKLLILSNSSTIYDKKIRDVLKKIDIVKLSLDCASEKCFKKIDRPLKSIKLNDIIEGMKKFRREFDGEFIVEILVVEGINDKIEEMLLLKDVLKEISPDRIDIGTIDRPPAYRVKPVDMDKLKELSEVFEGLPVNVAYKKDYKVSKKDFSKDEILALLKRRPQTKSDIERQFSDRSKEILDRLLREGEIYTQNVAGVEFYRKD